SFAADTAQDPQAGDDVRAECVDACQFAAFLLVSPLQRRQQRAEPGDGGGHPDEYDQPEQCRAVHQNGAEHGERGKRAEEPADPFESIADVVDVGGGDGQHITGGCLFVQRVAEPGGVFGDVFLRGSCPVDPHAVGEEFQRGAEYGLRDTDTEDEGDCCGDGVAVTCGDAVVDAGADDERQQ